MRSGDVISPELDPAGDSAPGTVSYDNTNDGITGTVTLSQGSTVLDTKDFNGPLDFDVPPPAAPYQLSLSSTRTVPWSNLATRVDSTWGFNSGHVDSANVQTLSLWTVRVDGDFDGADRAPAGVPFRLTVVPDLPQGAPTAAITAISLAASFDDGATWQARYTTTLRDAGRPW